MLDVIEMVDESIDFTFQHDSHTYRVGNRIVPSVTRIISPLYSWDMVNEEMLRLAAERGSAVHLATELHDKGDLDESSVDDIVRPYLQAYRKFLEETCFVPTQIERRLFNSKWGYATTLDRVGLYRRREIILELKTTSQMHPAVGVQLAAQREAWMAKAKCRTTPDRYALQLRRDGTYRFHRHDDPDDWPTFLSLLTVSNFRGKHKC